MGRIKGPCRKRTGRKRTGRKRTCRKRTCRKRTRRPYRARGKRTRRPYRKRTRRPYRKRTRRPCRRRTHRGGMQSRADPGEARSTAQVLSEYGKNDIKVDCEILVSNLMATELGKNPGYSIRVIDELGHGKRGIVYLVAGTDDTLFALKVDDGPGERSIIDPSRECADTVLQSHFLGNLKGQLEESPAGLVRVGEESVYLMDLAKLGDFKTYFRSHGVKPLDPLDPLDTLDPQNETAALMVLSILHAVQCMLKQGYLYSDMKDVNCLATIGGDDKPTAILGDLGGFMKLETRNNGYATYPDPTITPDNPGLYWIDDTWTSDKVRKIITWSIGILLAQISGAYIDHLSYDKLNEDTPLTDARLVYDVKDNNIFGDIIKKCLKNNPEERCTPAEICESLLALLPSPAADLADLAALSSPEPWEFELIKSLVEGAE